MSQLRGRHYCESLALAILEVVDQERKEELFNQQLSESVRFFVLFVCRVFLPPLIESIEVISILFQNRCDHVVQLLEMTTKGREHQLVRRVISVQVRELIIRAVVLGFTFIDNQFENFIFECLFYLFLHPNFSLEAALLFTVHLLDFILLSLSFCIDLCLLNLKHFGLVQFLRSFDA